MEKYKSKYIETSQEVLEAAEQLEDYLKSIKQTSFAKRKGNDIFEISTGNEYSIKVKILGFVK